MATQPSFFQHSKEPYLQPGRRVLVLVDFINPMGFLALKTSCRLHCRRRMPQHD